MICIIFLQELLVLFECVPAMILSAINSRPTTSSWPSNPLCASSLAPQIWLWLNIVRVYKLYLLTYLLISDFTGIVHLLQIVSTFYDTYYLPHSYSI